MGPGGMDSETLKIWAPPRPICFMASRSAVMPSLVMLPFIQCHQVWGRAWAGGLAKPEARSGCAAAREGRERRARAARRRALYFMGRFLEKKQAVYRLMVAAGCGLRYVGSIRPRGRGNPSDTGNEIGRGLAK